MKKIIITMFGCVLSLFVILAAGCLNQANKEPTTEVPPQNSYTDYTDGNEYGDKNESDSPWNEWQDNAIVVVGGVREFLLNNIRYVCTDEIVEAVEKDELFAYIVLENEYEYFRKQYPDMNLITIKEHVIKGTYLKVYSIKGWDKDREICVDYGATLIKYIVS